MMKRAHEKLHQRRHRSFHFALLIPLVAAAIWAAFLTATKGQAEPGLKLSPSSVNNILILLFIMSVAYTLLLIGFMWHSHRMYREMINSPVANRINQAGRMRN